MRTVALLSAGLLLSASGPLAARAASSEWAGTAGARVRLVTAGGPDAAGILRGALEIELAPGWKTYWRDPGDTGVPPRIDISGDGASLAGVAFPVPKRFSEEGAVWSGYEAPVDFGLRIRTKGGEAAGPLSAEIFLGICRSICIPFQARLTVDPGERADDPADAALVAQAFAQSPQPARPGFRLSSAKGDDKVIMVQAELPTSGAAELFLAAPEGYSLGPPRREPDLAGKAVFSVPVYDRPEAGKAGAAAAYTLVQGGEAVEGLVALAR
jgi:DsbC/DsbD-like thiol-disulfide interchange protein